MESPDRVKSASDFMKNNNQKLQQLALKAKNGEYVGIGKTRKLMKGKKHKVCAWCNSEFTLKNTARNDTKFCSNVCAQRASKKRRIIGYAPLEDTLICKVCFTIFVPKSGNQFCCSNSCRVKVTEQKRLSNIVNRKCNECSKNFKVVKSSRKKYCSVDCRKAARRNKNN